MAGLDTSMYAYKPIDFGDPMQDARNAMAMQTARLQQQQMNFNMMKAQQEFEHQKQGWANAAAARAKDEAATREATNAFTKSGKPGYMAYAPSDEAGAASDVGMQGGAQGYTPGSLDSTAVPAKPNNFQDTISGLIQSGRFDAAKKLMALHQAANTDTGSDIELRKKGTEADKADIDKKKAELETGAKALSYHAMLLPSVTQDTYASWRANTVKDLPGLDAILPQQPPADPNQFEMLKRQLIMKAEDGVKSHYQTITNGNQTQTVGINPITQEATPVPGTQGTTRPQATSDVGKLIQERDALDPNSPNYQANLEIYNNRIAKANAVKLGGEGDKAQSDIGKLLADRDALDKSDPEYAQKAAAYERKIQELTGGKAKDMASADAGIANAKQNIADIDALLKHPGLASNTGAGAWNPKQFLPGTESKDFNLRLQQVKGEAFLSAFNMLRGGGAITDVEGVKATAAINRMNNALSKEDFVKAANDAKAVLQAGVDRAEQMKAKGTWKSDNSLGAAPTAARTANAGPSPDDLVKMYAGNK